MAKVTDANKTPNQSNQNQGQQQSQEQGQNVQTVNIGSAFGTDGDSSRAAAFITHLKEHFERNGNRDYQYGTCEIHSPYVSVAYISFLYNQTPVCVLALFETQQNSIIRYNENNKQRYTTVASMVNETHVASCQKQIQDQQGYGSAPVYVTMQVVPRNVILGLDTVTRISAQLVTAIESRGTRIGVLSTTTANKYTYDFHDCIEGAMIDANGIAQRADWNLQMQSVSTDVNYNQAPVLESVNTGNLPAPVVAVGYTNLRFTGPKDDPRDFVDTPNKFNMEQLSPEMTVTQLDAVTAGVQMSIERSLLTLRGIGKIAQVGGWMNPLLSSLNNNSKRKLSKLAQHLYFATNNVDFESFDKDPATAIGMLCKKTAAVVVKFRKGDGVAGLASLFSEIAYGQTESLVILMHKLDSMFARKDQETFTQTYEKALGRSLVAQDIIVTAVPCPAGNYNGPNGIRSLDDMDLVYVANRIGDQFDHFKNYVTATSYDNRRTDVEETMLYQMNLAEEFYSSNSLRLSGDALDLVVSPVFINLLLQFGDACTVSEYNGVVESNFQGSTLFIGGKDFSVAGVNSPIANNSFGSFAVKSGMTF